MRPLKFILIFYYFVIANNNIKTVLGQISSDNFANTNNSFIQFPFLNNVQHKNHTSGEFKIDANILVVPNTTQSSKDKTIIATNKDSSAYYIENNNNNKSINIGTQVVSAALKLGVNSQSNNTGSFKPSPQYENFYEFNKNPVPQVHGEGRQFDTQSNHWSLPDTTHYVDKHQSNNKITFPTTSHVQPYNFVNNNKYTNVNNRFMLQKTNEENNKYLPPNSKTLGVNNDLARNYFPSTGFGVGNSEREAFAFNKPVEINRQQTFKQQQNLPHYSNTDSRSSQFNTYYPKTDYNLLEQPPTASGYHPYQKTYYENSGGVAHSISDGLQSFNPIKKILKLLATFIPIGLLISVLTPSVISVTNVNETSTAATDTLDMMRYRAENPKEEFVKHVVSSLGYFEKLNQNEGCEYRVFCELLVSASNMKNSEQHVENLLDNFTQGEENLQDKAEELRKVFQAVKLQDCTSIHCKLVEDPS